ncbi:LysE family translocator [Cupriavidus gilardii]|uniref:LysE family translocator n=1 Tax=Cupriavidus gilardii TaxID=82541 RepID=UPI00157407DB|nr:LysE family translocator [Cupriavidus gilardii]NSX03019.1 LysE family translocator [Cupriavidus gilardii]
MDSASFLSFLAISVLVIVTPGPDTALTIRNAIAGGRAAGIATGAGIAAGQLVWATATGLGLVAILIASEPVFQALRWLGAGYLVYLGVQSLRASLRGDETGAAGALSGAGRPLSTVAAFRQGVINDLANPKMAVFFASVLPQFAPHGHGALMHFVMLGMVFALMTFLWLTAYSAFIGVAGAALRRAPVRRSLDGIAGVALVGMGIRVAAADR